MDYLRIFAEDNHLTLMDGVYVGVYADMFVSLWTEAGKLQMRVCADLPKGAKKAALLEAMKEKQERYQAEVGESASGTALTLSFEGGEEAVARMERFLSECDVLLRPYTREMGILCGKCRREIHAEDKWEAQIVDGVIVPVCESCASGRNARGINRRVENRRRTQKGVLGALVGTLVSTVCFAVIESMGLGSAWLLMLGIGFILNRFYQRFGGIDDKWSMYMLSLCAVFSILFGWLLSAVGAALVQFVRYGGETMELLDALRLILAVARYSLLTPGFWISQLLPNIAAAVIGVFVFRRK